MENKFETYLLFARKAGKIVYGNTIFPMLQKSRIRLVLLANDIGESQKKKYLDKCAFYHCPVLFYASKDILSSLLQKNVVAALGITEQHLASAMIKERKGDDDGKVQKQ